MRKPLVMRRGSKSPVVEFDHDGSSFRELQRRYQVLQNLLADIVQRQFQSYAASNLVKAVNFLKPSLQVARDCVDKLLFFR